MKITIYNKNLSIMLNSIKRTECVTNKYLKVILIIPHLIICLIYLIFFFCDVAFSLVMLPFLLILKEFSVENLRRYHFL